jgi:hypothetical protein
MSQADFELYRFEYIQYGERIVDWVWLKNEHEALDYMAGEEELAGMVYRKATVDETDLYDEAFTDGRNLGVAETRMEMSNGVTYRLNSFSADSDSIELDTTKLFNCGQCNKSGLEFDVKAASTGEYYVSTDKDGVLWHVCTDCAADCRHDWTHFSSEVCSCGSMHDYCDTCSEALNCPLNSEVDFDSPYRRKKKDD